MDTRTLGYIGLGVLIGIVVATVIGIPPFIWITAAIVALVVTAAVAMGLIDGSSDAARMLGLATPEPTPTREPVTPEVVRTSEVEMEVVRPADLVERIPAVWLHRLGGRRVHRYEVDGRWIVERVSTKDPDNPRKRVIGEPLTFLTEADAIAAADELAQGATPGSPFPERPNLTPAEA
jgi:hypothetical protein